MKKCPNCGYERRPADDKYAMAPPTACPRCYAPYEKFAAPEVEPEVKKDVRERPRLSGPLVKIAAALVIAAAVAWGSIIIAGKITKARVMPPPSGNPSLEVVAPLPGSVQKEMDVSDIHKMISPSVVSIVVYNDRREVSGRGTGFFTSASGEVVTNHHVMKGSSHAEIKTAGGNTYPVTGVIAEDAANDIIRLATGAPAGSAKPLRISTYRPQVGEKVVVIGSPLGLEQTVSDGIVSAYRKWRDYRIVLQITAPISPGSSGSPVVNLRGEVIGMAFMQFMQGQNLNFCIPGEVILSLGPGPGTSLSAISASPAQDKLYFFMDESMVVHFVRNPENPKPHYILLTKSDGSIDRDLFERWVFEQIGGDPSKIDPQAQVDAEREKLPEYFRKIFPGREMEDLPRLSPEARGYWGSWVANHLQAAWSRAESARSSGMMKHRQMMALLDRASRPANH